MFSTPEVFERTKKAEVRPAPRRGRKRGTRAARARVRARFLKIPAWRGRAARARARRSRGIFSLFQHKFTLFLLFLGRLSLVILISLSFFRFAGFRILTFSHTFASGKNILLTFAAGKFEFASSNIQQNVLNK